jgi:plastocyanin
MVFSVDAMERADFDERMAAIAAGESPPPGEGGENCGTTVELAAVESLRFDKDTIEVPAGEAFCIRFTNNDAAPHDVGIVETEFDGDNLQPGESVVYEIEAMEPGEYTFLCTLHPQTMSGDLIVTE